MMSITALYLWGCLSVPGNTGIRATAAALECAKAVDAVGVSARAAAPHLRIDNDRILEVVRFALRRSPSFGHLVATLELLDPVVYVDEGECKHRELRGCLQLVSTPGSRNLMVRIDPRQPIDAVVAQLAHELYHALEIAREPDVVDAASLRDFYSRIGERRCPHDPYECWESRAAVAFEALVMREINTPATRHA
jgi:hypothetical protein